MNRLLGLAVLFACAATAEVAGNWKATATTDNGTIERTFAFKVDGNKLTGETVSSFLGKSVINDGKVDGDNLSFTIMVNFQGNDVKVNYTGKVGGNEIKLTAEFANGGPKLEWSGKRQ